MKNITTMGTPSHDRIDLRTSAGAFSAHTFDQDGCIGVRTEFVANTDNGTKPGRPSVSLEFDGDGTLRILIYDRTSEDPVDEITFKDGVVQHDFGGADCGRFVDRAYWDGGRFGAQGAPPQCH